MQPQTNALVEYVEAEILPRYSAFDGAHRVDHAQKVIRDSLEIAGEYPVDADMVYTIAAYHDLGLAAGRKRHELESGRILLADQCLPRWFSPAQRRTMKEAVEDHRASASREPRSIYGKIVAEADRDIAYATILRRTVQYSLGHFPDYAPEQHWERTWSHMEEKYGRNGYLRLWLDTRKNREGLEEIRRAMDDRDRVRRDFDRAYEQLIRP